MRRPRWIPTAVVGLTITLLLGGGLWFYRDQRQEQHLHAARELGAIARLKASEITAWRAAQLGEAGELTESAAFVAQAAQALLDGGGDAADGVRARFRILKEHYHYSDVLLADSAGLVRLGIGDDSASLSGDETRAVAAALAGRRPTLTDLHAAPGGSPPRIAAVAPLFLEGAPGAVGAVVLRSDARQSLYPLVESWPEPTRTAEAFLVRRDGDDVLFLTELRYRPGAALALRVAPARGDMPAVMAALGREGAVQGKDYRGVDVVAVALQVAGSPWSLVAKADAEEALALWRLASLLIVALFVGLGAAAVAAGGLVWQRTAAARYQALFEAEAAQRRSEERHRVTLMSVGDGVISTDTAGTVELMNPMAEVLTGWRLDEARGRPLEEVFCLESPENGPPAENPVRRALREGAVAGTTRHTLLARGGARRPIAAGGAPMRDAQGGTAGAVLVFRDASAEERALWEREATLELLSLLNRPSRTVELVRGICGLLQKWTRCEAVGVRLREGDDFPYVETRGLPPAFVHAEGYLCGRDRDGRLLRDSQGNPVLECMCGNVLAARYDPRQPFFTARGSFWTNSTTELLAATTEADRQGRTRNRCNSAGYESMALIRLRHGEETLGLLQVNDRARGRITPGLVAFLESSADQIAIAIAQRQAQTELSDSEEHYRSLFGNMLNGFAYCKMLFDHGRPCDFVYLEVNDAFAKLTGLDNVVGRRVTDVIPGFAETDGKLLELYGRVALAGTPERFETFVQALGMWFSISVYSPQKEHFVAVFDVITERKQAEAGRQLLSSAIEQAAEVIVITDRDGTIQYVNPAFEAVTGYSRGESVGRNPRILKSGEQDGAFYHALWDTIAAGRTWKGRFVNRRKDGTLFTEDATISPVRGSSGEIVSYVAAKRDITNELRLESELMQAQKMESVGRLAGGVAHDFNNMLQVITSYTEMAIGKADPSQPIHQYLQQVHKAARRSADLTRQLLAFARRQTVSPRILDLNDTVSGMLKMLQRLIGEDIDLAWLPGRNLANVRVDPRQIDQILANLAVNAHDAIDGVGRLTVETANVAFDDEYCSGHPGFVAGQFVMLAVSDDGRGMGPDTLSHLFEPFFTTKAAGKGTGLGLATVYGIVKQSGGFINVYSEPAEGSTFRVYLPQVEATAADGAAEPAAGQPLRGSETVLVVEDEAAILDLCTSMLEGLGYSVVAARRAEDAIRAAAERAGEIDLLITDVVMPQMNGRALAERIRASQPRLRCLYMSGYTADVIAHRGVLDEGVQFLPKPFSVQDLAAKVRQALEAPGP